MPRPSSAVVIPCLNEEEPIAGVVREVLAQGVDEVIVVDNGSTDATAARARAAGARVVIEPARGYGRACAAGHCAPCAATPTSSCFIDGDGSDVPAFLPDVVGPFARGEADFVHGLAPARQARARQHDAAAGRRRLARRLRCCACVYGVRFTDMSPFRAIRADRLRRLGMSETTYGWNLEMQMRAAAAGLRVREVPVDHRCRRGGVSKVSGNFAAGLQRGVEDRHDLHAAFDGFAAGIARTVKRPAYRPDP